MIYLKSVLAGIAAFLLYAVLFNLIAIPVMMHLHPPQMPSPLLVPPAASDSSVGFDVNTNWVEFSTPAWLFWLPGIVVFCGAFYWIYRRSRLRTIGVE